MIEKFTRCPRCRSFSLNGLKPDETNRIPGGLSGRFFVCSNCGIQYVLQGDTLEEIANFLRQRNPETKEKEPVRINSKTFSRAAVFLIPVLFFIIVGMILLLNPGNQDREQVEVSPTRVEEKTIPSKSEDEGDKVERKGVNLMKTLMTIEPKSYKLFDFSGMKVRKSSPRYSDKSFRWYFRRIAVTIKRSKTQRVYIAGDPTGKKKWAVDDEISVNGERIKGFSGEMTKIGYIPESKQVPPYDITYLVPSDRETKLDIRLVDYGIFWGNTSLYIVVM
ncbi:MAG: hypothetical protein JSV88_09785 [Candidatus Aminicenantes bacterium]|nr:MAG: hypothetical protein JSV88_09785 [Candidatus Aminicenantes bacterium]